MADFVHLHNHSDFSLLDAAQTVDTMCNRVYDLKMDSIAITEHGNLFSMIPFYKKARETGIKPIIGCEIYVAVNKHTDKKQITNSLGKKWGYHHLVLLAQNNQGYKNLMALSSIGYLEGFYYRPRVDKDLLKQFNEGLIATSACLAGEVTSYAAIGDYENAKKAALSYAEIFPDRFYLELQDHNIPEEQAAHKILKKLSKELNIPLIATNDCHYCMKEDSDAHDVLFCLGTGKNRSDTNRLKYEPHQFYIKSPDEMFQIFKDVPQALENTVAIAEQCNVDISLGQYHLPKYPLADNMSSPDDYLKQLCFEGMKKKYSSITPDLNKRLEYELSIIKNMGYAGYFLITQDFVKYAKQNNIPVGPGRGSAAGSLVSYCTDITDVDPIQYNLIFERFLNPERVTMPDIDIDFCIEGRDRVINYIKDKYGHDSVAQIITFGTMKAKSVIRDVGRVLGMSYGEVDSIAKLIPNEPKMNLRKALKMNSDLKKIALKSETHKQLIDFSQTLEGCHRHASTHAAGVVVTPGPLTNYVPLFKSPSADEITTQVDMNGLEEMGLLKMDFLGLRNLTVIQKTIDIIKDRHNKTIDIAKIDLDNQKVFKEIFQLAHTTGIFQFESEGMREYLLQLEATSIEDLIQMTSLYRPGPMSNIPEFIARKKGNAPIKYLHPSLEKILKETYGIIVYQEQVMQISSQIGGFTLAEADILRRAMGKKKKDLMSSYRIKFIDGATKQNINKKIAIEIFEFLEKFAEYGFNKSHAAAYTIISYQTAWLKCFYPIEFLTANISSDINDTDRLIKLLSEAKRMDIEIKPPNINYSSADFTIQDDKTIRYGLAAVKNVGYKSAEHIANYRLSNKKYKSIFDLCMIDELVNKKVIESLILSGACDDLKEHRAQQFESLETIISFSNKFHKNKNTNQESLFGDENLLGIAPPTLPDTEAWSVERCSKSEKELLGFYLTHNPLSKHENDLKEIILSNKMNNKKNDAIKVGGIIADVEYRFDKNNNKWALLKVESLYNTVQVYVFNDAFQKYENLLLEDNMCFFVGRDFNQSDSDISSRMVANQIYNLDGICNQLTKNINIKLNFENNKKDVLNSIETLSETYKGNYSLILHIENSARNVQKILINKIKFSINSHTLQNLRNEFGNKNVWLTM